MWEWQDHVRERNERICSEICDECMSRDIDSNDGAGCDNETFMIVQLGSSGHSSDMQQSSGESVAVAAALAASCEPTTVDLPPLPQLPQGTTEKRPAPHEDGVELVAEAAPKRRKVDA